MAPSITYAVYLWLFCFLADIHASKTILLETSRYDGILQKLSRRQTTQDGTAWVDPYFEYLVNVTVGTPPQPLQLVLAIATSDTWLLDTNGPVCHSKNGCLTPFDSTKSSSFDEVTSDGFSIIYADNSTATGSLISDVLKIGNLSITLEMGYVENGTNYQGLLGIGYDATEVTDKHYPNLMDYMSNNNLISSKSFSIWLNDIQNGTGNILFGGVDTGKFTGDLAVLPNVPYSGGVYSTFRVNLTSLSITVPPGQLTQLTNSTFDLPVVLDSATPATYLPQDITNLIYSLGNVIDLTNTTNGLPWIECDAPPAIVSFTFGSTIIEVPSSQLIYTGITPPPGLPLINPCALGVFSVSDDEDCVLGSNFLRSAFAVFHLGSNQIGLAQSNLNSTISNIVDIPASGIPSLTAYSGPSTTTSASSTGPTTTTSQTSSPTVINQDTSSSNNHTVPIAVGVAVPVAVIAAGLIGFLFWKKRRASSQKAASTGTQAQKNQDGFPNSQNEPHYNPNAVPGFPDTKYYPSPQSNEFTQIETDNRTSTVSPVLSSSATYMSHTSQPANHGLVGMQSSFGGVEMAGNQEIVGPHSPQNHAELDAGYGHSHS